MKNERRHELKENSLERGIRGLPAFWDAHGGKILAGAVVVALAIFLYRYRAAQAAQAADKAGRDLAVAEEVIERLRQTPAGGPDDAAAAQQRQEFFAAGSRSIDAAVSGAAEGDAALRAQALVDRGDLNWLMANGAAPAAPSTQPTSGPAATMPSAAMPSTAELLKNAGEAYATVVSKYPDQPFQFAAARLGLGAVAEESSDWAKAREQYKSVADDAKAPAAFKQAAQAKLAQMDDLEKPVYVGAFRPATPPPPARSDGTNGGAGVGSSILPQIEAIQGPQPLGPNFPRPATTQPATTAP